MFLVDPFHLSGSDPVQASFVGAFKSDASNATSHTIAGVSLGDPADDRWIFLLVHTFNMPPGGTDTDWSPISSVTVGGISASLILTKSSPNKNLSVGLLAAFVPTGTTGDIVLDFTTGSWIVVGVYRVISVASDVPVDTDTISGAAATSVTLTLPQLTNGIGFFGFEFNIDSASAGSSIPPDYNIKFVSGSINGHAIGLALALSDGDKTVTATAGFTASAAGIAASFR